jgi:two-component system chemotaxis response regulator CheB
MIKLLIVDDSALMRRQLSALFDGEPDFIIRTARNGREAVEENRSFEPHVVTLDINMPEMDGLELLSELSARGYLVSTAVVIVSTESSAADVERGLRAGAAHYLKKPFQQQDLWSIVSRYLGIGRPEPEPRAAQGRERGS